MTTTRIIGAGAPSDRLYDPPPLPGKDDTPLVKLHQGGYLKEVYPVDVLPARRVGPYWPARVYLPLSIALAVGITAVVVMALAAWLRGGAG